MIGAILNANQFPHTDALPLILQAYDDGPAELVVNNDDHQVLAVGPDGAWGVAPAGTKSRATLCTINGNTATFNPAPGKLFVYPYFPSVPSL